MVHALIIDDNSMNIDVLAIMLDRENISYDTMVSPKHVIEFVDATDANINVIFLDLEMPNYDGFDVLNTLKAHEKLDQTSIIAYTVHTSEIDKARSAGFDGFLGKPLNSQQFPEQLQRILSGESVWEIT